MAEAILSSVVDSITGELFSLFPREIGLGRNVKAELKKLQTTVTAIAALLREAEKRQVEARAVKDWLKMLKDVLYEADDLLDDFSTEALRRRRVTGRVHWILNEVIIFFSSSNQLIYSAKMARRVLEIREKIDSVSNDRFCFQLEGSSSLGGLVETRETHSFLDDRSVIGRDEDKEKVVEFLLDSDFQENVSILPIVGSAGLGKTTLAKLVFNDERVLMHFQLRLWVCVSTKFVVDDILRNMVRACTYDASPNVGDVKKFLRRKLDGKRFLLVLDDVWNENRIKWFELQRFVMNGSKGSKILVTTRSPRVAKTMTPTFHVLCGLPENESLFLLMRMAWNPKQERRNQNLERIAKEILKKCAGVPLAIKTIGELLFFRNTEKEWLETKDHYLSSINQMEDDIMPSRKLSYNILPSHLKQCFAYCSLFPKDYELELRELIHLWMAQGFIKSQGRNKALEEVGHGYFMELLSRSFFQVIKEDEYGEIISCKVHESMHDLAVSVAGDNCIVIDSSSRWFPKETCHVSTFDMDVLTESERDRRVRSLLHIGEKRIQIAHFDVSRFRNLRALRLRYASIKSISGSISKLKHLRSLDLSFNYELKNLPNSINRLSNLETLDLVSCWLLERLPTGITELVNLRQLDVSGCGRLTHLPKGIGKLASLQRLSEFVVGRKSNSNAAILNELSRLRLRKGLTIRNLERVESNLLREVDASFSMEKFHLQFLGLHWDDEKAMDNGESVLEKLRPPLDLKGLCIEGYGGVIRLSSWIFQLRTLVVIELRECHQCKHLPPLDQLSSLKRISLFRLDNLEYMELSENSGRLQSNFFPSLGKIELRFLEKFKGWQRSRRWDRIEQEEEEEEEEDIQDEEYSLMLPSFSCNVKVEIVDCPIFSYRHGEQLIKLMGTRSEMLKQLSSKVDTSLPCTTRFMIVSVSSISLSVLTSLTVSRMGDVEYLPAELFRSLPSLQYLAINCCPRLKALPVRTMLRYLTALETLAVSWCEGLDLSIQDDDDEDGGGEEGTGNLPVLGHRELCHIKIRGIEKMESLPRWLQRLPNLQCLEISHCFGLKFLLPGRQLLTLLTALKSLRVYSCPQLDLLTGESEVQGDMPPDLQFSEFRELVLAYVGEMETLPWWILHLTNLESLVLRGCRNLKALPEWFPFLTALQSLKVEDCGEELTRRCQENNGVEDWHKICHILDVTVRP